MRTHKDPHCLARLRYSGAHGHFEASDSKLLSSGEFSDVVLKARNGDVYHLHKAILCFRSPFFYKAMTSGFKESHTGVVNMSNDDPYIVNALVDYMYKGDYAASQHNAKACLDFCSINRIYRCIRFHIEMYCLGNLYVIPGLQDEARRRFAATLEKMAGNKVSVDFLSTVKAVYETTPEQDRGLRSLVIKFARDQYEELLRNAMIKQAFTALQHAVPDFAADLEHEFEKANEALLDIAPTLVSIWGRCPACDSPVDAFTTVGDACADCDHPILIWRGDNYDFRVHLDWSTNSDDANDVDD
ncbi:POZ domain-containing protein [Saccharata proteae CBS 121410]|uniref:POZ domain-containing protein n=1 Tax=Saccharata proteae CBS 121410 TaxID=1314787 RepID=A0A9P4LY50_9PEZI|nr:POZ domain-containing protein [Saccharata proteae CBS 121410]